ncbi:recombinase family protein [Brevibacillus brevis]|uniref:Recombinase family protein n=1 Tax=Brevibacillus brevis TaxID=1393 RepID=A0A517I9H5_BREBE|nr:recombinase family protein [Brevibacillus brevis]QDS35522.1 recombinase family protein [Brevibacillus brevis]
MYRVSIKSQVEQNDIPMQKNSCHEFIQNNEWKLVREYTEKGISGFKKSLKQRDDIQRIIIDAREGLFDILLVFMFDRLGRKEDETPFIVEGLSRMGIEV